MKSLKARSFVATTTDIEVLTREYLAGVSAAERSRGTYLTAHIATTQVEVGAAPRERAGKPAKLSRDEIAADLKAMEAVHSRFYAAVVNAAKGEGLSGEELESKIKFARSSASTFRSFIKAGGDLRALAAERTTKYSLRKLTKPDAETRPHRFERHVARIIGGLDKLATEYAKTNKEETLEAVRRLVAHGEQLMAQLVGKKAAEKAAREPKALKHKTSAFIPQQHAPASAHAAQ